MYYIDDKSSQGEVGGSWLLLLDICSSDMCTFGAMDTTLYTDARVFVYMYAGNAVWSRN